jgi:hypothetical protein
LQQETRIPDEKLHAMEMKIDELTLLIQRLLAERESLDDWISHELAMKLTGLGRTKLYEMRKQGLLSASTISGKETFYRRSDLIGILNRNEKLGKK